MLLCRTSIIAGTAHTKGIESVGYTKYPGSYLGRVTDLRTMGHLAVFELELFTTSAYNL